MLRVFLQIIKKPNRFIPGILIGFLLYTMVVLIPHIDTVSAFASLSTWQATYSLIMGLLIHNAALVGIGHFLVFLLLMCALSINMILVIELIGLTNNLVYKSQSASHSMPQVKSSLYTPGFIGYAFAVLGYGCAACGTAISSSLFTALGLTVISTWLPLKGLEFSLIGFFLIIFSIRKMLRKISTLKALQGGIIK